MDILIDEHEGSLWVAALNGQTLTGLEIDPIDEGIRYGSIYWAKVKDIDTRLDAAWVDLDGETTGLLANQDIRIHDPKTGTVRKGGDKVVGKILSPGQMIAVQAKSGVVHVDAPTKKTAKVSMDISLPGRYLIHTPLDTKNRVSSRIKDKQLRGQMESMLEELQAMNGFILRAAAANTQTDMLQREAKLLSRMWQEISKFFKGDSPELIALGPDALQRLLSDQAASQIKNIQVITMDHFQMAEEWCDLFAPDLVMKINPIELENPHLDLILFDTYDSLPQIQALRRPYLMLPSGGNIIIQPTAALTAIDVNSAADRRNHLEINIEAIEVIARQIRLRNIGGIIMIDLLKMKNAKDRAALIRHANQVFAQDPCTVDNHGLTKLGLLELTRTRRAPSLAEKLEYVEF